MSGSGPPSFNTSGGQMRNVGSKAGGFLNNKFFHPSTRRNQEKMWREREKILEAENRDKELARQREKEKAEEEELP